MEQSILLNNGIELNLTAVRMGADLAVTIAGGILPHAGCCVLAVPRASLSDPQQMSSTSSILNVCGHKDDIIARQVAEKLSSLLDCTVVVTCGIHFDHITKEQMDAVLQAPDLIVNKIVHWIRSL